MLRHAPKCCCCCCWLLLAANLFLVLLQTVALRLELQHRLVLLGNAVWLPLVLGTMVMVVPRKQPAHVAFV